MEIKDKKLKKDILKELQKKLSGSVAENDLKPKTKMVIKAEGDSPEQVKEEVIEKLQKLKLPDEKELEEMEEEMPEEMMEEDEDEDDFMNELPEGLRKALMKKLNK